MYIEDNATKRTILKRIWERKRKREEKRLIKEFIYTFLGGLALAASFYIFTVLAILIFG